MIDFGIVNEGMADYPLKKLDTGFVVPDAPVADVHRAHQRQTKRQVEYAVEADELGYDYVFQPERHFTLLGPNSPNPLFVQTAVAAQTEDIRLLQMANNLPWHEPVRLAEQIAMLDILSDGRVEAGIGRGSGIRPSAVFGQYWGGTKQDFLKDHQSFEEKYELLLQAWTDELVSHHGQFHDVPPNHVEWENFHEFQYLEDAASGHDPEDTMRVDPGTGTTLLSALPVFPQPQQDPHPQLWKPGASEGSIEWAARHGVNCCLFILTFDAIGRRIDQYHEAAREANWPDHRPEYDGEPFARGWDADRRRGFATMVSVFNTEIADEETFERWKLGQEFNQSSMKGKKSPEEAASFDIDAEKLLEEADVPIVGDTDEIIDQIAELHSACDCEDLFLVSSMKSVGLTHDENLAQLRAFAEEVVPYFQDRSA